LILDQSDLEPPSTGGPAVGDGMHHIRALTTPSGESESAARPDGNLWRRKSRCDEIAFGFDDAIRAMQQPAPAQQRADVDGRGSVIVQILAEGTRSPPRTEWPNQRFQPSRSPPDQARTLPPRPGLAQSVRRGRVARRSLSA
jgi:hypothetical protein